MDRVERQKYEIDKHKALHEEDLQLLERTDFGNLPAFLGIITKQRVQWIENNFNHFRRRRRARLIT